VKEGDIAIVAAVGGLASRPSAPSTFQRVITISLSAPSQPVLFSIGTKPASETPDASIVSVLTCRPEASMKTPSRASLPVALLLNGWMWRRLSACVWIPSGSVSVSRGDRWVPQS